MHIEDFLDWLDGVEDYFECMGVEEHMKVKFVAYKLKGGARAWWKQLQHNRFLAGQDPIASWPRMKQLLRTRFLPTNFSQTLYLQCINCKQGSRTVKEYTEEFYRLAAHTRLIEDESQQVARFIGGLKVEIQEKLELNSIWSLNEAVNLAMLGEKQVQRSISRSGLSRKTTPFEQNKVGQYSGARLPFQKPAENSPVVEKGGPSKQPNPYVRPTAGKCFRCNLPGHRSNEFPTRPKAHLVEQNDDSEDHLEDVWEDDRQQDTTVLEGDEGTPLACILERLLLAEPCTSQRNSIFRTRCTVQKLVCEVIIDNGSCENFISKAMVKALNLPTTKHTNPYKLGWVCKGIESKVAELCKVSLSIGTVYAEEITCDVIDMDTCHILLGRPWQYDRDITYRGKANTCSFIWHGREVVLIPSSSNTTKKKVPQTS